MSGRVGDLSDEQIAALDQLRTNVDDILMPSHDDYFLLRWLRARNFNVSQAESMLRENLQWRKQNSVDTILDDYEPTEVGTGRGRTFPWAFIQLVRNTGKRGCLTTCGAPRSSTLTRSLSFHQEGINCREANPFLGLW